MAALSMVPCSRPLDFALARDRRDDGDKGLGGGHYRTKPQSYYSHVRKDILTLLGASESFGSALEIGCGTGETLGSLILAGQVQRGIGVEPFHSAAQRARDNLSEVFEADVEEWSTHIEPGSSIDLVIAADVLEHLNDPWNVLKRIRQVQEKNGVLLLSIPNVQHYTVSIPLSIRGEWRYVEEGLLDRTHLRFFTLRGIREMVRGAGYRIEMLRFNAGPRGRLAVALTAGILRPWLAYQYLLRCEAV